MTQKKKIIIVGGGSSGLACAFTLLDQRDDLDITVLESESMPGGRMYGEEREGFHIDYGATIFLESYGTVPVLAEKLGVELVEPSNAKAALIYNKGRFLPLHITYSFKKVLRTLLTIFSFRLMSPKALFQFIRFSNRLRARSSDLDVTDYTKMLDLDTEQNFTAFMHENNMLEYLEQSGQVDIGAYTCGNPEQVGAGYAMLLQWGFSLDPNSRIKVPELGIGSFIGALAEKCSHVIRLSSPVQRIVLENGKAKGVIGHDGEFMEADAVICATPATVTRKIIPNLPDDVNKVLDKVTYSTACVVCLALDVEIIPDYFVAAFPRRTGAMMGIIVNIKFLYPKAVPEGKTLLHVALLAEQGRQMFSLSDEEIIDRVVQEMQKYFPAMPEKPLFGSVRRWNEAVCQCPGGMLSAVNDLRNRSGLEQVEGLFLAGDYLRFPVTDGALQSGVEAAEACMSFFSQSAA